MSVRLPAAAGVLYPNTAAMLVGAVNDLMDGVPPAPAGPPTKCLVVPHASLTSGGRVAAAGYATLGGATRRVVVVGPAHDPELEGILVSRAEGLSTPVGLVDTLPGTGLLGLPGVRLDDQAHAAESSVETQLAFLLNRLPVVEVLPVLVGLAEPQQLADLLDVVWGGPETLVVVSANLSGDPGDRDERLLARLLAGESGAGPEDGCSWRLVEALAEMVRRRGLVGSVLARETICPAAGEASSTLTCAAVALHEPRTRGGIR